MMRAIIILAVAGGALAAAGCASIADRASEDDLSAPARGRNYAQRECGACHALAVTGASPRPDAPSFGSIRMRYTGVSLERELEAIEAVGHYKMPALSTLPGDRRDLIAYIESLGQ